MVTKLQRAALTKEGYKIVGTHSAVKLCRWTKHQLRGRGGWHRARARRRGRARKFRSMPPLKLGRGRVGGGSRNVYHCPVKPERPPHVDGAGQALVVAGARLS